MRNSTIVFALVCIFGFSVASQAAERLVIRNGRGQVTGHVYSSSSCAGGACGRITDAAGRITGSFRTSGNTVRFYDRAGRPR